MPMKVYDGAGREATDLRQLLVRIPADLDAALRKKAAGDDRTLSQVVRAALRAYLTTRP